MIDKDPIRTDARREARNGRLGANPVCVLCPERRVDALIPIARGFLQQHHVSMKANDRRLVIPLCLNCHAVLTEKYRTAGIPFTAPETVLHRVIACLRGVGAFLPDLGQACRSWADQLERFMTMLDARLPDWRARPEAK